MHKKINPIGIMQGRLSPSVGGRIQSFPVDTWRDEFPRAREAGLDCIEWVYEFDTEADNPLVWPFAKDGAYKLKSPMARQTIMLYKSGDSLGKDIFWVLKSGKDFPSATLGQAQLRLPHNLGQEGFFPDHPRL